MKTTLLCGVVGLAGATVLAGQFVNAGPDTFDRAEANLTASTEFDLAPQGGIPDVIVWEIQGYVNYSETGFKAYSVGTTSCNQGTVPLAWFANNNQHPVIGQNMFRLAAGNNGHMRFEQLGQSWLKHGFCALSQFDCGPCQPTNCNTLGIGCSDPYTASRNGTQSSAGPKYQVNATTGFFPYPPANPSYSGQTARRLRVNADDVNPAMQGPDARYFVEAQYVCPDENAAIDVVNARNNVSWREVSLNFAGNINGFDTSTQREAPGIAAWKVADPQVELTTVTVPNEGTIYVGSRVYDNGDGTWDYEYAVHNQDVHRSVGSVSIPVADAVSLSDEDFNDVDYHSGEPFDGTDWAASRTAGAQEWATTPHNENTNANAIRWGNLFNFRFTANAAPAGDLGDVTLGLFMPGGPSSVTAAAYVPSVIVPVCDGDFDDSGAVDFNDLVSLLSAWGDCSGCPQDLDGNGEVAFNDLVTLLSLWGDCP